jgi:cobalt-zinc-cadmium resistance protein CzcA
VHRRERLAIDETEAELASTDIIGFLPRALATSAGTEVQRPLATVVVGGLLTAILLTLHVLPVVYSRGDFYGDRAPARRPG